MPVEYSEYKGHKLIVLKSDEGSRYPFSFGKKKARLIVENFEAIKAFAEADEAPAEEVAREAEAPEAFAEAGEAPEEEAVSED